MVKFAGYVTLGDSILGAIQVVNSSGTPINADAKPTYRIYGPDGFIESGPTSFIDSGTITGATNASPIVITDTAHGLTTGARVTITGVGGNTAANGTFTITKATDDTFSLDGSTGNGSYTSGGKWTKTGVYIYASGATGAGYKVGDVIFVVLDYELSSTGAVDLHSFIVS